MRYYPNNSIQNYRGGAKLLALLLAFLLAGGVASAQVTIGGSVYGGGNKAEVTGAVTVDLEAGTVAKSVYGGGNKAGVNGTTTVNIQGGTVGGNDEDNTYGVYGGCNSDGTVTGNVTVNIQDGTLGTSSKKLKGIFGGGYGSKTATSGNVTVTIGLADGTKNPTLFADIYGGSALGSVNTDNSHTTKVDFLGGTLHGNLYGGGLGKAGLDNVDSGKVNGVVQVNIGAPDAIQTAANCHITLTGCSVYGCNNTNGSPQDNVFVNIYKTAHTTTDAASYQVNDGTNGEPTYAISQVFGGGNNANYTPENKTTTVSIFTCENTIGRVFGGGDAASAVGVATVIDGGRFNDVFGGGNGELRPASIGAGGTNLTVHGGYINRLFGGSNTQGSINGPMLTTIDYTGACGEEIKEFFGGSNKVPINNDIVTTIGCGTTFVDVYGGSNEANIVGNVTLNINGGTFTNVYGGSKGSTSIGANIKDNPGGNGTKGNVTLNLRGGTITNAFGGSNINGNIESIITVNVDDAEDPNCPLLLTNLYGGNNLAIYTPNDPSTLSPIININHIKNGNTIAGNVFGGGKGMESTFINGICQRDNINKGRCNSNPQVIVGDNAANHYVHISGNVYGGGELAEINGSTSVLMQNAHTSEEHTVVAGNLFGAGKGYVGDSIAANVQVNATVTITGGRVQKNVYGGGELASVGTFATDASGNHDIAVGTGTTTVTLSGGIVGTDNEDAESENANGNVYGAGLGSIGETSAHGGTFHFAYYNYVKNSNVSISGDAHVMGSVFGGAEDGHVWDNTYVRIKGGTIGSALTAAQASETEGIGPVIYTGNVYGGGRGINPTDAVNQHYSLTAGRVFGNTYVEVSGGTIHHDVFGGGSLASVGDTIHEITANGEAKDIMGNTVGGQYRFNRSDANTSSKYSTFTRNYRVGDPISNTGLAHVRITGGQIGVTGINEGSVFGSGRGMASADGDDYIHMAFVHNAKVYIKDTTIAAESRSDEADIRGSVFGGGANGHVTQNAYVEVDAGTVGAQLSLNERRVEATGMPSQRIYRGNVYGSGRGVDYYTDASNNKHLSKTAGRVYGNTEVLITGGTIRHSVFGGGSLASVGTYVEDNTVPSARKIHYIEGTGQAKVTMTGGRVGPKADDLIKTADGTYIDELTGSALNAAIAAAGYDGSNHIWKPRTNNTGLDLVDTNFYYLGSNEGFVFGSGRGMATTVENINDYSEMAFTNHTIVDIKGDAIVCGSVFGGGENGHVKFDTKVNIHGNARVGGIPLVSHHDNHADDYDIEADGFWEGDGSHKILLTVASAEDEHAEDVTGTGKTVFRGSVYGGGRGIDHTADPTSPNYNAPFSASAGRVYGNTEVNISENAQVFNNVFGGGSIASVGTFTMDDNGIPTEAQTIYKYTESSYNANTGTFTVAQSSAVPTGSTTVNISGGIVGSTGHNEGYVFGASRGLPGSRTSQISHLAYCDNAYVTISDLADVRGSVFGGGMNGHVLHNTDVLVSGGFVGARPKRDSEVLTTPTAGQVYNNSCMTRGTTDEHLKRGAVEYVSGLASLDSTDVDHYGRAMRTVFLGNVYGAGRGIDNYTGTDDHSHLSPTAGRVYGNTHVKVTGGYISHNVYGGGSIASVGDYDLVTAAEAAGDYAYLGEGAFKAIRSTLDPSNSGRTYVEIQGGQIGDNGINNGLVFGSSRGMSGNNDDAYKDLSYANITRVTISGNADIRGCVFGSGENGHVADSTLVEIQGGEIGNGVRTGSDSWANTYIGNVYGGGRGVDLTVNNLSSRTSGWVRRATHVKISGGHVHNSVYGGGSLAAVGTDGNVGYHASTDAVGRTWVDVTGGLIGTYAAPTYNTTTKAWERNSHAGYGSVYGGGRGRAGIGIVNGNDWSQHTFVNNTVVRVNYSASALADVMSETATGTQHIVGNVFGGGNNGHVNNSTDVRITRGRIGSDGDKGFSSLEGNVFGGGRGEDTYEAYLVKDGKYVKNSGQTTNIAYNRTDRTAIKNYYNSPRSHNDSIAVVDSLSITAGLVYGNTNVTINGASASDVQVMRHVYGGGSMASVGDYWISADGTSDSLTSPTGLCKGEIYRLTDNTGICTVNIYGGTLGTVGRNNGMVFGGCRGLEGAPGEITDSMAYYYDTYVTIGRNKAPANFSNPNPLVNGSVYGGGENGHGVHNTNVTIHSGHVGNHGYLYDNINTWYAVIDDPNASDAEKAEKQALADEAANFLSYCGNVYGGGCGTDKYVDVNDGNKEKYNTFAGVVFGNATVNMDGGYVERHIYGGGAMANLGRRVGTYEEHHDENSHFALSWPVEIHCRPGSGLATVNISGGARVGYSGMDNGDIFGASRGEAGDRYDMAKIANVDSTSVTINISVPANLTPEQYYSLDPEVDHTTPMVAGALHGGAENGHVIRSTNLVINSGLVSHSVYGGGKGKDTYEATMRKRDNSADSTASIYSITAGRTYGNTHITMTGGMVGRNIYGGGNLASVGKGNFAGGPGDYYESGFGEKWTTANQTALMDSIAKTGHTYIYVTGGIIGKLDPTTPKNSFKDDLPLGNVFGGCRGMTAPIDDAPNYYYAPIYYTGYVNHTHITIGDSTAPVATPNASSPRLYGSVYGGGQDGHVRVDTRVAINDAEIGVPYGSPTEAHALVGIPSTADIAAGRTMLDDIHWVARGNVYGAGSGIGKYTDKHGDKQYNGASGSVACSTYVAVNGGLIHRNVYGGGSLASVGPMDGTIPDSTVSITRVSINGTVGVPSDCNGYFTSGGNVTEFTYGGNVFGASRGMAEAPVTDYAYDFWSKVNVGTGANVIGNVYGGGEIGQVKRETTVNVTDGRISKNVYGGGKGDASNHEFARVMGNTEVNVSGGRVITNVYGGGEMASVGTITDSTEKHTDVNSSFALSWPYKFVYTDGTGIATVNITGGRIGITGKDYMGPLDNDGDPISKVDGHKLTSSEIKDAREDNGDVYGGGKGFAANRYTEAHYANVKETHVTVNYATTPAYSVSSDATSTIGCIAGALYGGAENGHVYDSTVLTINQGLIGHAVYGAGKGTGTYSATLKSRVNDADSIATAAPSITAGKVYGNTYIKMTDGHVVRNIFGGGNRGSVGKGNYAGGPDEYYTQGYGEYSANAADWTEARNSGHTYITVTGGTIGGTGLKDNLPYGNIFGACRGEAAPEVRKNPRINYCPEFFVGYTNNTHVVIGTDGASDGPTIWGSVYGGAQDGHVRWNSDVKVYSGTIGLEYSAANKTLVGTDDVNDPQWAYRGNVFGAGSGIGTYTDWQDNEQYSYSSGSVTHKATTTIYGGTVNRNVYGGGNLATVGPPKIGNIPAPTFDSAAAIVNIYGGTLGPVAGYGGTVYGSSRGMSSNVSPSPFENYASCHYTQVNLGKADGSSTVTVPNSVLGGGENGQVTYNTEVNLYSGATVGQSIYGGGKGAYVASLYEDEVSGRVKGNTTVNLLGGTVGANSSTGDVYGGCHSSFVHGNTQINIGTADQTSGNDLVVNGEVYGANNVAGNVYGNTRVDIYHTGHTAGNGLTSGNGYPYLLKAQASPADVLSNEDYAALTQAQQEALSTNDRFALKAVYGGGNLASHNPTAGDGSTMVYVHYCEENTIGDLYGGGNAASTKNNHVIVEGGRIKRLFGGGNGYSATGNHSDPTAANYNPGADVNGTATTEVHGGLIDQVFGGSNQKGDIGSIALTLNNESVDPLAEPCPQLIIDAFGGGNEAEGGGGVVEVGCGAEFANFYAGANMANIVGDLVLNVNGGRFTNLYGGSKGTTTIPANIEGNVTVNFYGGHVVNLFGGSYINGNITGQVTVNVDFDPNYNCPDGMNLDNVYGGSNLAQYRPDDTTIAKGSTPLVNLIKGHVNQNVYGAGRGSETDIAAGIVQANPRIHMIGSGFQVDGNLYGGGELASVKGITSVVVDGGTVGNPSAYVFNYADTLTHPHITSGHIFGGSKGLVSSSNGKWTSLAKVDSTSVTINGGTVRSSVYGGGEMGNVLGNTAVTVTGGTIGTNVEATDEQKAANAGKQDHYHYGSVFGGGYGSLDYSDNTNDSSDVVPAQFAGLVNGNTKVILSGGQVMENVFGGGDVASVKGNCDVNVSGTAVVGPLDYTAQNGYVYAAGKGVGDDANENYSDYCNVNDASLTVSGGKIWGSIFGGGADCHVLGNTHVTVHTGADVGDEGLTSWDGNIFGGGRNYLNTNYTAGRVAGNVTIDMDGGTLMGSIFGGGRLALTGIDADGDISDFVDASGDYDSINHGMVTINVSGGSIGNPNGRDLLEGSDESVGDIFGSGKGDTKNYDDTRAGMVMNTHINISGNPRIYGAVFGGGEMASVGWWDESGAEPGVIKANTGTTQVDIAGTATIGTELEFDSAYLAEIKTAIDGGADDYWTILDENGVLTHTCTGNVFGGCQGDVDTEAPHWVSMARSRQSKVTISGNPTIMGSVFGGAEQGVVTGNTSVAVTGGTIGTPVKNANNKVMYILGSVYGGGYGIDSQSDLDAHKNDSCAISGSDTTATSNGHIISGRVYGSTYVTIGDNALVRDNVFGGGQNALVSLNASVAMTGGQVGDVNAGGIHGNVYGSGMGNIMDRELGCVKGNTDVHISGGSVKHNVYGGGSLASVGTLTYGNPDPTVPANQISGCLAGTGTANVYISGGIIGTNGHENGMIFGSSRGDIDSIGALMDTLAWVYASKVTIGDTTTSHNMTSPQIKGSVYGGGENGHVKTDSYVHVYSGQVGYQSDLANDNKKNIDKNDPTYEFRGNVYGAGCGTDKFFIRDTIVKRVINGTLTTLRNAANTGDSIESVYSYNMYAGVVQGNTYLKITGGHIFHNVYGGGAMANVGSIAALPTYYTDENHSFALSCPNVFTHVPNTGTATIDITGGRIGTMGSYDGDVFGGARGEAGDRYAMARYGNVRNSVININYPTTIEPDYALDTFDVRECITGSVYGGAENGHINDSTYVTLTNGLVGHAIYGGGKGKGTYTTHKLKYQTSANGHQVGDDSTATIYSITAGKVSGNTRVVMNGGHVVRNVFGGGNQGSVGKGNYYGGLGDYNSNGYGEKLTNAADTTAFLPLFRSTGTATVIINDGIVGKPSGEKDDLPLGNVFGGCRGTSSPNVRQTLSPRVLYYPIFFVGYTNRTRVIIGDGTTSPRIYGSVYGGGMDGHVRWDSHVRILSGEIGNEYNDANKAIVGSDLTDKQWVLRGNVYGSGSGIGLTDENDNTSYSYSSGSITQFTRVDIEGGTIHRNVYGGGSLAIVGPPRIGQNHDAPIDSTLSLVNVIGGTVGNTNDVIQGYGGNVYGGSRGIPEVDNATYSTVIYSRVNVSDAADVKASVYGGGEIGRVKHDARVDVSDGVVGGNVFGGGKGDENNPTVAGVMGNTTVNVSGGKVIFNVYGGGELASVGTITDSTEKHTDVNSSFALSWPYKFVYADGTGEATVNITGGRIGITGKDNINGSAEKLDNGDIYGGGKGLVADRYTEAHFANVNNTNVNIHYNTTVSDEIYKDSLNAACITGAVYGGGENGHVIGNATIDITQGLIGHAVYGGGKGKDTYFTNQLYKRSTNVNVTPQPAYDSSANVYSLTAGKVYGNTSITMTDGHVVRSIFGGGNLASVGKGNYAGGPGDYNSNGYGERIADATLWADTTNSGHTVITILGGTLGQLSPSNPTKSVKDNIPYGSVFGGCRGIAVPDVPRSLSPRILYCPEDFLGYVNKSYITIGDVTHSPRILGSVYGGGQDGHVRWNTYVHVLNGEIGVPYVDDATATATAGTSDLNDVQWLGRGNVYGGGSGIGTWDSAGITTYSNISGSVTHFSTVDIEGGTIHRNVYGGGSLATVGPPKIHQDHDCPIDSTLVLVNVKGGTVGTVTDAALGYGGNVYGASRGDTAVDNSRFSTVLYSQVNISDNANILASVYGGGEVGSVKHDAWVNITGGTIGDESQYNNSTTFYNDTNNLGNAPDRTDVGHVYGAGKGYETDNVKYQNYCNVEHTHVAVSAGRIYGSVYGGAANAHVTGNTDVAVSGGTIGTKGVSSWDGSVFGGGQGNDLSLTAGRVGGDITVNLTDGFLFCSVYGGGRMGRTGVDASGDYASGKGNVNVNVSGGALGNTNPDTLLACDYSVGDIFGSGRGDVDEYDNVDAGRVANAVIVISGDPVILGSVFGGGEMAGVGYWDATGTVLDGTGITSVTIDGTPTIGLEAELHYTEANNPGQWTMYDKDGNIYHTCTGNVYGGSQGDVDPSAPHWVSMARSKSATVTINSGTIRGCIFGGAEQGTLTNDAHVIVNGGTIGTDLGNGVYFGGVYGAGYGCDDPDEFNDQTPNDSTAGSIALGIGWHPGLLAGRVFGNASVDILGGTINGDVFGGGSFASVGDDKPGATVNGNTIVNIGNAQGQGNATIHGEVFGANNFDGSPFGSTQVNIYHTAHTTDNTHPAIATVKGLTDPSDELTQSDIEALGTTDINFALKAVYGGGNLASHTPLVTDGTAEVHVYYCEENTVRTVYGGGNAANTQNNLVTIDGGRIYQVFGGGNGYSATGNHTDPDAPDYNPGANVSGTATTHILGGLINDVFGGSNSLGDIANIDLSISQADANCDLMVANTYGGGNEADGGGGIVNVGCGTKVGSFYGGSRNANITGDLILNVTGGVFENVFGGSKGTASKAANIDGNVTVNVTGGHIINLFGGSDINGNVTGKITINVDLNPDYNCPDGLRIDNVYGGGNMALYQPTAGAALASPEINIISETAVTATETKTFGIKNVYGGGLGDGTTHSSGTHLTGYSNSSPVVNIGGIDKVWDATLKTLKDTVDASNNIVNRCNKVYIRENVYGGGSAAPVEGNPTVVVYSNRGTHDKDWDTTAIRGTVFGGGFGPTAVVNGNTTVGIFGDATVVEGNVYGGGNAGILTGSSDVQVGYDIAFVASQPTVSVAADNKVTLYSATPGSTLYYTTDGTMPTTTSNVYSNSFYAEAGVSIRAIAMKAGFDNSLPSTSTTVHLPAPTITLSGSSASIANSSHGQSDATIYYTLDGSAPTVNSNVYTGPVNLTTGQTLKAIAVKSGYITSPVATATVTP